MDNLRFCTENASRKKHVKPAKLMGSLVKTGKYLTY